jgi:hypothetical protein
MCQSFFSGIQALNFEAAGVRYFTEADAKTIKRTNESGASCHGIAEQQIKDFTRIWMR